MANESANKVEVEGFANKEVLLSSGQLDPGERDQQVTAKDKLGQKSGAKQDLVKSGAKQDLDENGGVKPLLDPGEAAEVKIEEIGAKDELEACCIAEVVVKESATEKVTLLYSGGFLAT